MLLAIAAGSLIALPLSGLIVSRYGSRRTVTVMVFTSATALAVVALGYIVGVRARGHRTVHASASPRAPGTWR